MLAEVTPEFDQVILTQYSANPRYVPMEELHRSLPDGLRATVHEEPNSRAALQLAERLTPEHGMICVTGSFFIAAELRGELLNRTHDAIQH